MRQFDSKGWTRFGSSLHVHTRHDHVWIMESLDTGFEPVTFHVAREGVISSTARKKVSPSGVGYPGLFAGDALSGA